MQRIKRMAVSGLWVAGVIGGLLVAPLGAEAGCVVKRASGTGGDAASARFQVDEALLQAVDWGAWASWMATGSTPGYSFGKRSYSCKPGGIGVTCVGSARICKL